MAGENRIAAGFRYIYVGRANASGYLAGNIDGDASNGTIVPMQRVRGARTFPVEIPDRDRVPVSGDDEPLVTFTFASEELPSGVMATAVRDLEFEAKVQGTLAESIGDLTLGALAPGNQANETMMMLLQREAKKFEGNTKGTGAWEILLVPAAEITPLGSTWEQRTFNPYNYAISISKAARALYGATYTEALRGTTELALEPIFSDNPIMIEGGFGNASAVNFTLAYTPVSSAKMHVYLNGVKQALTTNWTLSGRTLTFLAAPGSGVHIGIMYEVAASALS